MAARTIACEFGLLVSLIGIGATAQAGTASSRLDFESLKAKCVELSGNQQLKPFKAVVTCRDVSYVWRPGQSKETQPLQNAREVGASIRMKGFETPYSGEAVPVDASRAPCIVMDKMKITVPAVDNELSCDELTSIADLTQFCLEKIEQRVQEDPSLIIEEATGERFSSCTQSSIQGDRSEEQAQF